MNVVVIDYGVGNLNSVRRAFEECGADALISRNPLDLAQADRIVLPGVGAFAQGMANLHAGGWPGPIGDALQNPQVALLGLCLGMQLLADRGFERGLTPGLGLVPGEVHRLQPNGDRERIPHVGWNEVETNGRGPLFAGIPNRTDFYFVHSYHFITADSGHIIGTTPYCGTFVSAVQAHNVFGTQFHPEKSSSAGFQLLRNFLQYRSGVEGDELP
jgi:glutamine amidotransferase